MENTRTTTKKKLVSFYACVCEWGYFFGSNTMRCDVVCLLVLKFILYQLQISVLALASKSISRPPFHFSFSLKMRTTHFVQPRNPSFNFQVHKNFFDHSPWLLVVLFGVFVLVRSASLISGCGAFNDQANRVKEKEKERESVLFTKMNTFFSFLHCHSFKVYSFLSVLCDYCYTALKIL